MQCVAITYTNYMISRLMPVLNYSFYQALLQPNKAQFSEFGERKP